MIDQSIVLKAADLVAAYASRNEIEVKALPELLETITLKMVHLTEKETEPSRPVPPVPIDESYTDQYIICLEDEKKVTLLKRYLSKHFDMTPEEYIEKWGLPEDYPFVTKEYSEKRSQIAKDQGLGKS